MGAKDTAEKTLEAYNDVFADILNVLLFDCEQVVREDELFDAQPFSQYKADDGSLRGQERDVAKYWQDGAVRLSFLGFENQTEPEEDMALRVIGYDGAAYRSQLLDKARGERYPVVTLVLYFGTERHWNAPRSLKERFRAGSRLAPFVSDYRIQVFELAWLSDAQINGFKSDFRLVAEYLRAKRTGAVEDWTRQELTHVHEIMELLRVISNDDVFTRLERDIAQTQQAQGGVNMCDFVQKIRTEGIALGRTEGIAVGERRGIALGRTEGITLGRTEGETTMMSLFSKLFAEGRIGDAQKASTDRAYLRQLLDEYQN